MIEDYKLPAVKWKLYNENALTWVSDLKFDFVIGNPPYITYEEIDGKLIIEKDDRQDPTRLKRHLF